MNASLRIIGPNFSGRSRALCDLLSTQSRRNTFYVGPYAESGLSGIGATVGEELGFYGFDGNEHSDIRLVDSFAARQNQRVATLSGGEQTLLAIKCYDLSGCNILGIDTALEQLDSKNREGALLYLSRLHLSGRKYCIIDNRQMCEIPNGDTMIQKVENDEFPLTLDGIVRTCPAHRAPKIAIRLLQFSYPRSARVFTNVSLTLSGGRAYRLHGPNGSGKSTFLRLASGVLKPTSGILYLDGKEYYPNRRGNEIIAWAMQDPDHQWVATTVQSDLSIKIDALRGRPYACLPTSTAMGTYLECFGITKKADHHLLDFPKALRKRLSWLWPLSGILPWIALDEPTLGQDRNTVLSLAQALTQIIRRGLGLMFVTHNEEFASLIPHETLVFGDQTIVPQEVA